MSGRGVSSHAVLGAGIVAISFAAVFTRLADAPAPVVAALRMAFSAAMMAVPAFGSVAVRRELRALGLRSWCALVLAGFFLALHFMLWISSLSHTTVASSVVLVTTSPLWVGLYLAAIARRKVPKSFWAGFAVALAGGAIIGSGDFALGGARAAGDLLATGGAVAVAGYFLVGSSLRSRLSIVAYVFPVYAIAAAILVSAALASGHSLAAHPPRTYLYCFLMALVCQTIGHSIFNWALRHVAATAVATATLGEPVGAGLLAFLILGEAPGVSAIIGGAMILGGIAIVLSFDAPAARELAASGREPLEEGARFLGQ